MKILVINGPNINLLGTREPDVYGKSDYPALCSMLDALAKKHGITIDAFQSNTEGEIVGKIQQARGKYDGIVINPAAYTHYSIAILDALKAAGVPAVEVHLSNIAGREEFRRTSVTAAGCIGQISGLGFDSYLLAVEGLMRYLGNEQGK
jgi:3-dehydroquinate dehydratase-2